MVLPAYPNYDFPQTSLLPHAEC